MVYSIMQILLKELARENVVYCRTVFKESNSHESVYITGDCQQDLLYWRVSACCIPLSVFSTQSRRGKPMFNAFVKIFSTKACFSLHITHFSGNFKWFVILNHQRFYDRPLLTPEEHYSIPFLIASK